MGGQGGWVGSWEEKGLMEQDRLGRKEDMQKCKYSW